MTEKLLKEITAQIQNDNWFPKKIKENAEKIISSDYIAKSTIYSNEISADSTPIPSSVFDRLLIDLKYVEQHQSDIVYDIRHILNQIKQAPSFGGSTIAFRKLGVDSDAYVQIMDESKSRKEFDEYYKSIYFVLWYMDEYKDVIIHLYSVKSLFEL